MLLADAITPVPREPIEGLPRLKLIHSDGAGYNGIDVAAARERGLRATARAATPPARAGSRA